MGVCARQTNTQKRENDQEEEMREKMVDSEFFVVVKVKSMIITS